jgi:hypothetical protein
MTAQHPLHHVERALTLMTERHQQMGHDPILTAALARAALLRDFGYCALEAVDLELGQMSDESFQEAVLGSATRVPMTHLCGNVLLTMHQSIEQQTATPRIHLPGQRTTA